jgi:putative membrane-bound dehydrogenase-like protein
MNFRPLIIGALICASTALAYEEVAPPKNIALPPARSPAASLASITVPAGLRVELVAAEPLVMDPIDVAWGSDGRMWVVEMADYPMGLDGRGKPGGRIRVLSSSKNDGHYDRSTLFAEGLNFPNSVLPWRQGVLVAAAPDVLYLEDTDDDGRADRTEKRFVGFAEGNQQHRANGLQWSLDGWLHLANGNSGGKISSAKSGAVLDIGRRDLRLRPDEGLFEPLSGQTQYGRNRDDWGNWFGGNNSNPVWHYALDDRYLRRNPHLVPPNPTVDVPALPGAAPVFPTSTTFARFNDAHAANRFTSACGTMIYRDDLLGPAYAGNVFVCEPVHNLVHREIVRPAGTTFRSARAPAELTSEFFASTDLWSRFTTARTGPDGALYIVDMYRRVIEHPTWIPAAWQKVLGDLRAGSDLGRIYRVVPTSTPLRSIPRLDRAEARGLVAALENPSGTVRDLAQQELTWRRDLTAVLALEKLAATSSRPITRAQALCSLDTMGALRREPLLTALRDPHPGVLLQAVRLSEKFAAADTELLALVTALATHADATVRQQVAYTLGEWRNPAAGEALARLVQRETDPFIRTAALSSALPHADTLLTRLSAAGDDDGALVEIALATRQPAALVGLLATLCAPRTPALPPAQLNAFTRFLEKLRAHRLSLSSLRTDGGPTAPAALAAAADLQTRARALIADSAASLEQRRAAVGLLGLAAERRDEDLRTLATLLAPQSPVELQLAAVAALARIDTKATPELLLAGWSGYGVQLRAAALELLSSRTAWAAALLARLETERPMLAQIDAGRRAALSRHASSVIAARATRLFSEGVDANRQAVVERYLTAMRPLPRNAGRGATVFNTLCAACHRFGDIAGGAIGPDLAVVKDRSPEYLTTHILDPNRAIEDRYMLYTVTTHDGRSLAGLLVGEAGSSLTLLGLDGVEQTLLRRDLAALTATGRSLMPDGLESALDAQAMADLVAFIANPPATKK